MIVLSIGREQEEAFQTLKDNLCNAPILSLHNGPEDFVVYCAASNQGLGCVLMQRGKSSTHIRSEGVKYAPTKWIELFSDFDSDIHYHLRKANVVADALSEASKVENATAEMLRGLDQLRERKEDGGMYFIWVPLIGDVRTLIMDEAHASSNCLTWLKVNAETSKTFGFIVTVDRLTKSAHFLAIREDYKMEKLARFYIDEIVAGHGVPVSIISNQDGRFTSRVTGRL
ncbi:putative reverse transcriptase domain-containing protein [Tanacetum coccineum]